MSVRAGLLTLIQGDTSSYPHDYPTHIKAVVVRAVREAFRRLTALERVNELDEDEITARLVHVLNDMLDQSDGPVPEFSACVFETVHRDARHATYDGRSLEKQPDLVFRVLQTTPAAGKREYRALFVECKIVDLTPESLDRYCDRGIRRFVDGAYGWAMRTGIMVGYARLGAVCCPQLTGMLTSTRVAASRCGTVTASDTAAARACGTHVSRHARNWTYRSGNAPGPIDLLHVWVDTDLSACATAVAGSVPF